MELYVLENGLPEDNTDIYLTGSDRDNFALDIPCTPLTGNNVIYGACKPEGVPFYYMAYINSASYYAQICFDTMCDGALQFKTDTSGNKTYACVQHGADEPDDTYCQLVQQLVPANWTFL